MPTIARRLMLAAAFAVVGAAAAAPRPASAELFRWSGQADAASLDPHGLAEAITLSVLGNVYESLVRRGADMQLEPALAESWSVVSPTTWRFVLRRNVRFHDGSPMTADDVVFSLNRARSEGAGVRGLFTAVRDVTRAEEFAVDIHTHTPDPTLPQAMQNWLIMSRSWAERNGAVQATNAGRRTENYATRNANGTGPFRIASRTQDQLTVFEPHPQWWDRATHGITRAEFRPISSDATRLAALLSREVDLIFPVPPQAALRIAATPGMRMAEKPETRSIFLAFDVGSEELKYSDVRGRNPFRDARVRRAFAQSIDLPAIVRTVMRGKATPAGLLIAPAIHGHSAEADRPVAYDPAAARTLLAEAGYPNGFAVTLDCPNDRFVNDEQVCLAIAPMMARAGIRLSVNAMPRGPYFAKLNQRDSSFHMLGWAAGTLDAHHTMRFIIHSPAPARGLGTWNFGRFSDATIDGLIDRIGQEFNATARLGLINQVWARMREMQAFIPLYHQTVSWAHRDTITVGQRADDYFDLRLVRLR